MTDKFDIGYGKPPQASRFKPGQSGNPKGRPKGSNNIHLELEAELSEKICVREDGQELQISKRRALIKALIAKAIRGDTRAALAVIELSAKLDSEPAEEPEMPKALQPLLDIIVEDEIRRRDQAKMLSTTSTGQSEE
jgi:Family of unknown function (DUF5681)